MFECKKCGKCCRHLDRSELFKDLDRGDGVCKYLRDNLCSVYEDRPLLCRIEESYNVFFSEVYTKEEYCRLNEEACRIIHTL